MQITKNLELHAPRATRRGKKWVIIFPISLLSLVLVALFGSLALFTKQDTQSVYAKVHAGAEPGINKAEQGIFDLVINEFMASNDGSVEDPTDSSRNEDWIEIYNPSSQPVNLQGMYISDTLADPVKHQITVTLFIQPESYLLFWADNEREQGPTHLPFKLKSSGEAIALYAPDGTTKIDSHIFGAQQANVSEGRMPDGGSTWSKYLTSTPNQSNVVVPEISNVTHSPVGPLPFQPVTVSAVITDDVFISGATLYYSTTNILSLNSSSLISMPMSLGAAYTYGAQIAGLPDNTLVSYYIEARDLSGNIGLGPKKAPVRTKKYLVGYQLPTLKINEVMPDNASTLEDPQEPLEFPDWIEIYNFGPFSVSLNGLHFSDDPEEPDKYAIPSGMILLPDSYLVFFADDDGTQGPLHTNFKLSDSGEQIGLYGPYGAIPIDVVTFGFQPIDTPAGRFPNAYGPFGEETLCPTPGATNHLCNNHVLLPLVER